MFLIFSSGINFVNLYTAQTLSRQKEIGVRKVLGASVLSILKLINIEFVLILLTAAVLGGWGGYTLTDALLSDLYAQHISVSLVTILLASLFVFLIGIMSTSATIWSTANSNPVQALNET